MSPLATLIAGLIIGAAIAFLLVVGAAHRKSERQIMDRYLEVEEKKAQAKDLEKRLKAMPWSGADLNAGVDISTFIGADGLSYISAADMKRLGAQASRTMASRRRVKVYQPTRDTRAGTTGIVYYGQRFSAAIFDHIELVDPPRGEHDRQWIRDHLMTRIAPGGKLRLSKEMVPHGKSD